jgi:uncharacterized damage-inducible protein DinB
MAYHREHSRNAEQNRSPYKGGLRIAAETRSPAIVEEYTRVSSDALKEVKRHWSDDSLETMHEMYGDHWSRGTILNILLSHQTHHRAQMTVLMRQAGLVVPGIYGPAREEWLAMNMPALP